MYGRRRRTRAQIAALVNRLTTRQIAELAMKARIRPAETFDKIGRVFGFQLGFISRRKAVPSADVSAEDDT